MKVLILQLSDLHISSSGYINILKIEKIVDSLQIVGKFDECIVVCSGDIADKGLVNDYKKARIFFGTLISEIKSKLLNKYIRLYFVPGNHDSDFTSITRKCEDIINYYKQNTIEQHIDEEIEMFKSFYDFASSKSIFSSNKFVDVKFINFGNLELQLNLINSAFFSTLLPNDKELHFFPESYLNTLAKNDHADLVFTVMHHSTENFNWNSKVKLEDFIFKNSSLLFIGHDHIIGDKDVYTKSKKNTVIFAGGKFNTTSLLEDSEYNVVVLDTDVKRINSYSFSWDNKNNLFTHEKGYTDKNLAIYNKFINPKDDYIKTMKSDEKHQICSDFTNYFVFPSLSSIDKTDYAEKIEINDIDNFISKLDEIKRINIVGGENSGKTALLKYIYLKLLTNKIPIFFTIDDIRDKEIDKVIRPLFEEQYSDNHAEYEKFLQYGKSNKIAIVDDIDKIKNNEVKERFINKLKEKFEYLIISSKDYIEYDLVESIQNQMDSNNEIISFKINDFYLEKRTELIKKICKAKNNLSDAQINKVKNKINNYIHNEIKIFELNPDFIIQYTQYFIEDNTDSYIRNDAAFNKVFETNINNAIIANTSKNLVDQSFIILEELAYYIHFNKRYPLSIQEFEKIVKNYNDEYSEEVNAKTLQEMLCNAKIIKLLDNSYFLRFSNTNYLAFFVAKSLKRKYNDTHSGNDLEIVLKNIGFDINSHVMLFYSYLDSNQNVVMQIYNNAEEHMHDWDEFKLDDCSINYLSKTNCISAVTAPNKNDKQKIDKINNDTEKELKENNQIIECRDIYDYDEAEIKEFSFQVKSALKYTEFLVKALPGLGYMLKKDNKLKLIDSIYKYPNRIIYKLLQPLDENFEELIKDLKDFADENNLTIDKEDKKVPISEEHIEKLLVDISIRLIFNVYNMYAHILADQNSIKLLEGYEDDDVTHKIFSIMVTENFGNTESLIKKIDALLPETKDKVVNNLISQVVKKHLIYNDNIPYNVYQKIVEKYFKEIDIGRKKAIMIDKYKKPKK